MRGLIILANGFEDSEAITTLNILKRASINVDRASFNDDLIVRSNLGINYKFEYALSKVNFSNYDFLIIPGGRAVFEVLNKSSLVKEVILSFHKEKKLIAAICAAPSLLIENGLLSNTKYTCFPSFENLELAPLYINTALVVTENIISAKAMAYTEEFALAIVKKVKGDIEAKKVYYAIRGEE